VVAAATVCEAQAAGGRARLLLEAAIAQQPRREPADPLVFVGGTGRRRAT
jgi:hypothetical protein